MIPQQLSGFFVAGTGAAAALFGLLFVALSIRPERLDTANPADAAIATNTLLALVDAFFVAFGALMPATTCAWVALIVGLLALAGNLMLAYILLYRELNPRLIWQRSALVAAAFVIYGLQCWFAARLIVEPAAPAPAYGLAHLLLAVFALGIARAYGLTGMHPWGFVVWRGPRRYTDLSESAPPDQGATHTLG